MPTVKAQLLAEIKTFLKRTGMADSRFGTEAVGDNSFLRRLREPETDIMASTVDRVRRYMTRARKAS